MNTVWHEVPTLAGGYLWSIYRTHMGADAPEPRLAVFETITDPDGYYGEPTIMTVVGHKDTPVLKCVTTWRRGEDRSTATTRYYVPESHTAEDED